MTMLGIQCAFVGIVASRPEVNAIGCAGPTLSVGVVVDRHWARCAVFGEDLERFASTLRIGDYVYVEGVLSLHVFEEPQGPMKVKRVLNVSTRRCERLCNNLGRDVAAPWLDPHAAPLDLVAEDSPRDDPQQLPPPDDADTPCPY